MEISKESSDMSEFSRKESRSNALYLLLAFFFNSLMIFYASAFIDKNFLFLNSVVVLILVVFPFLMSSVPSLYQYQERATQDVGEAGNSWCTLYHYTSALNSKREECRKIYRKQGGSIFSWYALQWLGPICGLASWSLFYLSGGRSFWILTLGLWGWCLFFKLQTLREHKWCSDAIKIDHRFINIKIFQFIMLYSIPLLAFSFWGDVLSMGAQRIFFGFFIFIGVYSVLPAWFYLQLGDRVGFYQDFKWWIVSDYRYVGFWRSDFDGSIPTSREHAQISMGIVGFFFIFIVFFYVLRYLGIS